MKLLGRSCFCLWLKVSFDIKLTFLVKSNPLKSSRHPADPLPSSPFCPVAVFIPRAMQAEHVFQSVTLLLRNLCIVMGSYATEDDSSSYLDTTSDISKGPVSLSFSAVLFYIPSPFPSHGLLSSH